LVSGGGMKRGVCLADETGSPKGRLGLPGLWTSSGPLAKCGGIGLVLRKVDS
jgi:hypothetical protein